jgi:hypothetical protein
MRLKEDSKLPSEFFVGDVVPVVPWFSLDFVK